MLRSRLSLMTVVLLKILMEIEWVTKRLAL
jgi:hypothetical protein